MQVGNTRVYCTVKPSHICTKYGPRMSNNVQIEGQYMGKQGQIVLLQSCSQSYKPKSKRVKYEYNKSNKSHVPPVGPHSHPTVVNDALQVNKDAQVCNTEVSNTGVVLALAPPNQGNYFQTMNTMVRITTVK